MASRVRVCPDDPSKYAEDTDGPDIDEDELGALCAYARVCVCVRSHDSGDVH